MTWRSITGNDVRARRRRAWARQRAKATRHEQRGDGAAPAGLRGLRQLDGLLYERLLDLAAADRDDPSRPVDDEALGELVGAVGVGEFAALVAQVGIGEMELAHETFGVGRGVLIGDAEHGGAMVFQAALGVLEQRGLRLAGFAPRGPEVEHDDLARV